MTKSIANTLIWDVYGGQYVRLRTNVVLNSTEQNETEAVSSESTLAYEGYFNEEDDVFYHLGPDEFSIIQSVRKEIVIAIELGRIINEEDEFLDSMPIPENPEGVN